MGNKSKTQFGAKMGELDKKLDKILENQIEQGKTIVRIETYQKTSREDIVEIKKDHSDLENKVEAYVRAVDDDLDEVKAKINKWVGALAVVTFIFPFIVKYIFGGK